MGFSPILAILLGAASAHQLDQLGIGEAFGGVGDGHGACSLIGARIVAVAVWFADG